MIWPNKVKTALTMMQSIRRYHLQREWVAQFPEE
jgi:hypothetical protein